MGRLNVAGLLNSHLQRRFLQQRELEPVEAKPQQGLITLPDGVNLFRGDVDDGQESAFEDKFSEFLQVVAGEEEHLLLLG